MSVKPLIMPFGLALSILGAVQCIIWFVLSLLGILLSEKAIEGPSSSETLLKLVLHFINQLLLDKEQTKFNVNITQDAFEIFLFLYLVISLVWLTLSLYQCWALFYGKWLMIKWLFIGWAALAIASSIIDIILLGMLASDFNWWINGWNTGLTNCKQTPPVSACPSASSRVQIFAVAFVMILAVRGCVVWLLNVFGAVAVFFVLKSSTQEDTQTPILNNVQGGNNTYPASKPIRDQKNPYSNPAYVNDEDDEIFDTQSLARNPSFHYQENPWNNNNNHNRQTPDNEYSNMPNGKTGQSWINRKSKINNYSYGSIPRIRASSMSKYN